MTLRVMTGCDMGADGVDMWELAGCTVGQDAAVDTFGTSTPDPVFSGRRYFQLNFAAGGEYRVDFGTGKFTGDTIWGGFWWNHNFSTGAPLDSLIGIHRGGSTWTGAGGTVHDAAFSVFSMHWQGEDSNQWEIRDSNDSKVGDSFMSFTDVWVWVAFVCVATGSGSLTVKIDGKTIVDNVSGDYAGTSATGDEYSLCFTTPYEAHYDDLIFGDGAGSTNSGLPPPQRIEPIWPDGDSSNTGFTTLVPSSPTTRWEKIEEQGTIDEDTSYCESAAVSDEYTVTMEDILASPASIKAYQQTQRGRRASGGDTVTLRNRLFSNATYYNGTDKVMSDAYENVNDIFEVDPDTSADWTETNINAVLASGILV